MAKVSAIIFGVIFVIAGVWGLFMSPVIGFIAADKVSSIIHIIVGIVLLVLAGKHSAAAALKTVGIIYVIFAILGFIGKTSVLGVFTIDMATTWFYLVVGIIIAALGFSSAKKGMSSSAPSAPMSSTPSQM